MFRELWNTRMSMRAKELRMAGGTTEIDGVVYELEYRVLPVNCLSERVIIGDDKGSHGNANV